MQLNIKSMFIAITITIIFLIIIQKVYFNNENFTNGDLNTINKYLGNDKILNFSTSFNGKKYILCSIPKSACGITGEKECLSNVLVLMDNVTYNNNIKNLKQEKEDNKKICHYKYRITCEREVREKYKNKEFNHENKKYKEKDNEQYLDSTKINGKSHYKIKNKMERGVPHRAIEAFENTDNKKELERIIERECSKIPENCLNEIEYYNTDFSLLKLENPDYKTENQLYKLIGRVIGPDNAFSRHAVSNAGQFSQLNMVCLDGGTSDTTVTSSVEIIRIPNKQSSEEQYLIRIPIHEMFTENYPLHDKNGNPVFKYKYLGICNNMKCKLDGQDFYRLCLYENESNPFVLFFTPNIKIVATGKKELE